MGLVVLFVIVAYFAALLAAPVLGYRFAKTLAWRDRSCRWLAFGAFLFVFLPVFWDWIPVLWMHSRYCASESGLFVYQTPEQWIEANPGFAETIRADKPVIAGSKEQRYIQLNRRFRWEMERSVLPLWNRRTEDRIVDVQTGKVLVRLIDFMTGDGGTLASFRDIKIWMKRYSCELDDQKAKFRVLRERFEFLGTKP